MTLVSYWPLDEDSGTTAYDIAGSNNGSTSGATVNATGLSGTTAYSFDGSGSDYVDMGDAADLEGMSEITVTAWVNFSSLSSNEEVVGKENDSSGTDAYRIFYGNTNGNFRHTIVTDSAGTTIDGGTPSTGTWTFVASTWDGSTLRAYMDGVEVNSTSLSGTQVTTSSATFKIGIRDTAGTNPLHGSADEVRVYDHALSPAEIQYLHEMPDRGTYVSSVKTS